MTLTAVPYQARTRSRRVVAPVATMAGLTALTVALYLRDPHASGSWGYCPISLLGFYCPGCGSLRAVNDLTHGDLAGAVSSNALLIVAMPFAVFLLAPVALGHPRRGHRHVAAAVLPCLRRVDEEGRQRGLPTLSSWPVLSVVIALITVFTLARNLPGSWLAP